MNYEGIEKLLDNLKHLLCVSLRLLKVQILQARCAGLVPKESHRKHIVDSSRWSRYRYAGSVGLFENCKFLGRDQAHSINRVSDHSLLLVRSPVQPVNFQC